MSEQAPTVVEIRILDLPEMQSLINMATASIEALTLCLKNAENELARLRQEAIEGTSINVTVNVAESTEVQHD